MKYMRYLEIFDKRIPIRKYGCSFNNNKPAYMNPPRCNIFIQLTKKCNANCSFCEYHSYDNEIFDVDKLGYIIKNIHQKADIGKINFTGGEPTINMEIFDSIFHSIQNNIDKKRKPEITLNTNGIHLAQILPYAYFLDSIGLSRHHYNDNINKKIFRTTSIATKDEILEFQSKVENKKLIQLRCNLITGYIDSYEEIIKYLNHAIDLKCSDCGFVTLIPLNDFCKNHQVDFPSLMHESDDVIEIAKWSRLDENLTETLCQCSNYIYQNENGEFCRFYRRHFCRCDLNEGQLVYDGKNLRYGFGGEIIF